MAQGRNENMITAEKAISHAQYIDNARRELNKRIKAAAKDGVLTNIAAVHDLVENGDFVNETNIVLATTVLALNL